MKAACDCVQTGRFRSQLSIRRIGAANDFRDLVQRRVGESVFLQNRVKRTQRPIVAQLHAFHVEGNRVFALGKRRYIRRSDEVELGLRIDEAVNQPRTGDAVDLGVGSRDKLHARNLLSTHFARREANPRSA